MMWRKKWSDVRRTRSFSDKETYQRMWRSTNAWYRLTGRFSLFVGWTEKVLSWAWDIIRKHWRAR